MSCASSAPVKDAPAAAPVFFSARLPGASIPSTLGSTLGLSPGRGIVPGPCANRLPKPRILVVDDEPGLRDMLAILFRREGFDVTLAPGFARRATPRCTRRSRTRWS